jgi:DNA replication protein DnaC
VRAATAVTRTASTSHVSHVDEVGYFTYDTDAANMLFHVVNERHRRHRSMILTTNKALKAWGRVLHDEDLGRRSSTASSSGGVSFGSMVLRFEPCISSLTTR